MSTTDTPRTDILNDSGIEGERAAHAFYKLARALERELAQWRTVAGELAEVLQGGYQQGSGGQVVDRNRLSAALDKFNDLTK